MQCETAATISYRASQDAMNRQSVKHREINNHYRIKSNVEFVGNYISKHPDINIGNTNECLDLCLQVDGGHVKTKDPDHRSFKAKNGSRQVVFMAWKAKTGNR